MPVWGWLLVAAGVGALTGIAGAMFYVGKAFRRF